jgi:predicted metalloendopeptidase
MERIYEVDFIKMVQGLYMTTVDAANLIFYGRTLTGQSNKRPLEESLQTVNGTIGEALVVYVEKMFPTETKEKNGENDPMSVHQ